MASKKVSISAADCDHSFTVMLLGDSCTGKTCVLIRFKDGAFLNSNFISTVGIDYRIFDTAGQERFRSVTSAYYRDADALLLVFDVTNRKSFENIRSWVAQIKDFAKDNVQMTLVGNKVDLKEQRVVKPQEGRQLADFYSIPYIETSAKTGQNIQEAFLLTAKRLIANVTGVNMDEVVDLANTENAKGWGSYCCYSS